MLQRIGSPASTQSRTCSSRRSRRSGSPFTSSATRSSSATAITSSRSTAFGGRWSIIRPVGWLSARTAGWRSAATVRAVISRRGARWPAWMLAVTQSSSASTRSVQVERAVGEDVALDPAEDAEGREQLVRLGDLVRLAQHVVASRGRERPRPPSCGRRSPGTRSRGLGRPWPSRARFALPSDQVVWQWRSPRTSPSSTSGGGSPRNGCLAQLGRAPRDRRARGRRRPRPERPGAARAR